MAAPRPLLAALGGLLALSALPLPASAQGLSAQTLDEDVLREIDFARTQPQAYAETVAAGYGQGESRADVQEALDFLRRQRPLAPLEPDARLAAAAQAHTAAQGPQGTVGHYGADGASPSDRLHRQGVWAHMSAEDISYGYGSAREVVRQLIVDSGVPDRGHRTNIFEPGYELAGVGCGPHRGYRVMCVVDFAGGLMRR